MSGLGEGAVGGPELAGAWGEADDTTGGVCSMHVLVPIPPPAPLVKLFGDGKGGRGNAGEV